MKEKISFSITRKKTFAKEILDKGLFSKIWEEQKFDKKKKLKKKLKKFNQHFTKDTNEK